MVSQHLGAGGWAELTAENPGGSLAVCLSLASEGGRQHSPQE